MGAGVHTGAAQGLLEEELISGSWRGRRLALCGADTLVWPEPLPGSLVAMAMVVVLPALRQEMILLPVL